MLRILTHPGAGGEASNGHGRRQPGHQVVARQGNLLVTARRRCPSSACGARRAGAGRGNPTASGFVRSPAATRPRSAAAPRPSRSCPWRSGRSTWMGAPTSSSGAWTSWAHRCRRWRPSSPREMTWRCSTGCVARSPGGYPSAPRAPRSCSSSWRSSGGALVGDAAAAAGTGARARRCPWRRTLTAWRGRLSGARGVCVLGSGVVAALAWTLGAPGSMGRAAQAAPAATRLEAP